MTTKITPYNKLVIKKFQIHKKKKIMNAIISELLIDKLLSSIYIFIFFKVSLIYVLKEKLYLYI